MVAMLHWIIIWLMYTGAWIPMLLKLPNKKKRGLSEHIYPNDESVRKVSAIET